MVTHNNQPAAQITRQLATEAETLALGATLAVGLKPGMIVYLIGELGAGKTTLARGILHALGVTDRVKSPTYTLVEPYTISSLYLYHFDFYRLKHPNEWVDAGLREHFNSTALCLIEWPDKAGEQLPAPDVTIEMAVAGDGRSVTVSAETEAGRNCLMRLHT
jgi:tRNA threonylcarbamoyladenosine biosynthesis protein TsaE